PTPPTLFPYTTLFRSERPIAAAAFENAGGGGEPVESTAVVQKINPLLIGPSIVIDDDAIDIVADLAKPPRRDEHMMSRQRQPLIDRKSTRLNSSHSQI